MATSSTASSHPLFPRPLAPLASELVLCHPYYGESLSALQCGMAAGVLPSSPNPQTYYTQQRGYPYSLPVSVTYGKSPHE